MKEKIIDGYYKLKEYWHRPPKGYQVSYREIACFTCGFGGSATMSIFTVWVGLAVTMPLMTAYFKVSTGVLLILGWINSLIALIRSPILSMAIDNSNSKRGKFKPFLLWPTAVSCAAYALIPFIPEHWMDTVAFSFALPEIAFLGVTADMLDFSWGVLAMFVLLEIGMFFAQFTNNALSGIEQTITTNSQERNNINSVHSTLGQLPNSVINVALPIVAVWVTGEGRGTSDPLIYRIVFPFCAVLAFALMLLTYFRTEERAVLSVNNVAKVSFAQGVKALSKNKYFWIIIVYNIFYAIRCVSNFYQWICLYSIGGDLGDVLYGVLSGVLGTAYLPALLFGPAVFKKFGKKKVLCFGNVFFVLMTVIQMLVCRAYPYLCLVCIYGQNFTLGICICTTVMTSDALDYEQYRSGLRLEGFWSNFFTFITTVFGFFTALLSPLFLSFAGIKFNDNLGEVLRQPDTLGNAYFYYSLLGCIGAVLTAIPFFFWDLDEKRHADIVRVLQVRAAETDLRENVLTDADILNVKEISDLLPDASDFLKKELNGKEELMSNIIAFYPEAKARQDATEFEQNKISFMSNLAVEEKRLEIKIASAKKKAEKKNLPFDEEKFRADFIASSRFIKDKEKYIPSV